MKAHNQIQLIKIFFLVTIMFYSSLLFATSWTAKTPMTIGRDDHSSSIVNGKIYVIGGYGTGQSVEEYNPTTNSWATKTSIPTAVYNHTSNAVNGNIYIYGGLGGSTFLQIYNPISDTWSSGAVIPAANISTQVVLSVVKFMF